MHKYIRDSKEQITVGDQIVDRNPASSISKILLTSDHKVDLNISFKIWFRYKNRRLASFSEEVLICVCTNNFSPPSDSLGVRNIFI